MTRALPAAGADAPAEAERLRAALDSVSDGFMLFDSADRLVLWNARVREMFAPATGVFRPGRTFADILREGVFEHGVYDRSASSLEAYYEERLRLHREGSGAPFEQRLMNGRWVLARDFRTPDGGRIAVRTDITDLKQRELELVGLSEELREKTCLLDTALASMSHGLAMFDAEQRLVVCNWRYLEMFSRPPRLGWSGTALADIVEFDGRRQGLDRAAIDRIKAHRLEVARSRSEVTYRETFVDGHVIQIHHRPVPGGGSIAVYEDVTRREAVERALREAKEEAEMANRAKSEFLATMSHELRTPLNAIIGFSEIMENELFGALGNVRYREYMRDIHDSANHLLTLINDILDVAKVEAGRQELEEVVFDVDAVVESSIRLITPRAREAGVDVSYEPDHGDVWLCADERSVKQILLNLLSNAVKFTPEGGAVVVATALPAAGGLALTVRDTGIGIAAEDIPKALAPFGQVGNILSRAHPGTGLGLPLSRSLAELHNAEFNLESAPGEGTAVSVRFPPERLVTRAAARTG